MLSIARNSKKIVSSTISTRSFAVLDTQNLPLRSSWPETNNPGPSVTIPKRQIPDSVLKFQVSTSIIPGYASSYSHFKTHPGDVKVVVKMAVDDLKLNPVELAVLTRLVGPRYNSGSRILTLTASKFTDRMENKKYLTYLAETLVAEAKRLALLKDTA